MGWTVVYVTQYHVLVLFLCLFQFLQAVACACGYAFVALWLVGVSLRDMYSHQVKFVLQVEMVVGDYSLVVFLWKQGEQSFAVNWFRVWFSQVQDVQTFLKQCCQYLVFLEKKLGLLSSNNFMTPFYRVYYTAKLRISERKTK